MLTGAWLAAAISIDVPALLNDEGYNGLCFAGTRSRRCNVARALLCVACLIWSVEAWGLEQTPVQADAHYRLEFQDDQIRVLRVAFGPHEKGVMRTHQNGVLVFLTADLQGHMPPSEVQWEPEGTREPRENLANTSFEAILVELLKPPTGQPPTLTILPVARGLSYPLARPTVTPLVDNAMVSVTKERFPGTARNGTLSALPTDTVFVYLSGGAVGGTSMNGPIRVRRGEADVLPAHTLHQVVNLGFDPIELIVIHLK